MGQQTSRAARTGLVAAAALLSAVLIDQPWSAGPEQLHDGSDRQTPSTGT